MPETPQDITPAFDGGVMKTIIRDGEGISTPGNGAKVRVHYTGTLTDATVFDTSRKREPFEFELGKSERNHINPKCYLYSREIYA